MWFLAATLFALSLPTSCVLSLTITINTNTSIYSFLYWCKTWPFCLLLLLSWLSVGRRWSNPFLIEWVKSEKLIETWAEFPDIVLVKAYQFQFRNWWRYWLPMPSKFRGLSEWSVKVSRLYDGTCGSQLSTPERADLKVVVVGAPSCLYLGWIGM